MCFFYLYLFFDQNDQIALVCFTVKADISSFLSLRAAFQALPKLEGYKCVTGAKQPWTAECCGARLPTFHRERHTSAQPCIKKGTAMHTKYTSQAVQPIDKTATHRGMKRWQSAVQCSGVQAAAHKTLETFTSLSSFHPSSS